MRGDGPRATACEVSVLVVSFNTRELTLACVESVEEQTRSISFETLLVDNASCDGSASAIAARFPRVKVLRLDRNIGFAPANNVAAERARGEFILLLNPDTVVLDGAIETLVGFARRRPDAGIWGGRTVFADGSLNPTSCWGAQSVWSVLCRGVGLGRVFAGSRLFDPESLGWWGRDTVREVATITGCFLLIRRDLWDALGGFDPRFTMYGEEVDLCIRARRRGARPTFTPDATIIHYGGKSEAVKSDQVVRQFVARARLMRKHFGPISGRVGVFGLSLWAWNKWLRAALRSRLGRGSSAEAALWREIVARRREWRSAYHDPAMARPAPTTPPPAAVVLEGS